MTDDNQVSATLTTANITAIKDGIAAIRALLPFLVSLSAQDRMEMAKLGDKSMGFDAKCAAYMASNPAFLPGFIILAEVLKDRELRDAFMQFVPDLRTLCDGVEDTLMVINSEIWMADLAYYQSVREASRRNRAGAEVIYTDLRSRFPGANPTPTPTPGNP